MDKAFKPFWTAQEDKLNLGFYSDYKDKVEDIVFKCIEYRRPDGTSEQESEEYVKYIIEQYFLDSKDYTHLYGNLQWTDKANSRLSHNVEIVSNAFLFAYEELQQRSKWLLYAIYWIGTTLNRLNEKATPPFDNLNFYNEYRSTSDRDFSDRININQSNPVTVKDKAVEASSTTPEEQPLAIFHSDLKSDDAKVLFNELCKDGFLDGDVDNFLFRIGCKDTPSNGEKLIWMAKNRRTGNPSKISLIDFLVLIGVRESEIRKSLNDIFLIDNAKKFRSQDFCPYRDFTKIKSEYHDAFLKLIRKEKKYTDR